VLLRFSARQISNTTHCRSYDLFESQISDAFVRARTRGRESYLVFMVERGNDAHRRIVSDCTKLDAEMQHWTERLFHDPGSSVPPRSLRETTKSYHSDSEDDESNDYIKDPTTSGRIYLQDAIAVVYRLAASLDTIEDEQANPSLFEYEKSRGAVGASPTYVCTIIFPLGSPVSKVSGPACISVPDARRAACYQACIELFDRNVLDYRLFPLSTSLTSHRDTVSVPPGQTESHLNKEDPVKFPLQDTNAEVKTFGTHCYPRKKPDFWDRSESVNSNHLYPTVIATNYSDDSSRPYTPLLILTRHPLPPLPSFRLFFSNIPGVIQLIRGASFEVDEDHLEDIHLYTIRICRAIANKPFTCPLEKMQYFFAPLAPTWKAPTDPLPKRHMNISKHIPWDLVTLAANSWVVPLASRSLISMTKDIEDAVIQDRWVEFTRRYEVVRIRPDLTPMSKPVDSPVCHSCLSSSRY
jgi:endoribonuclease Dicer